MDLTNYYSVLLVLLLILVVSLKWTSDNVNIVIKSSFVIWLVSMIALEFTSWILS